MKKVICDRCAKQYNVRQQGPTKQRCSICDKIEGQEVVDPDHFETIRKNPWEEF